MSKYRAIVEVEFESSADRLKWLHLDGVTALRLYMNEQAENITISIQSLEPQGFERLKNLQI